MQYTITSYSPLAVRRFVGLRNTYVGCISNMLGIFLNVQVESLKKENSTYGLNNVMLIVLEGSMITNLRCLHICELQQHCSQLSFIAYILEWGKIHNLHQLTWYSWSCHDHQWFAGPCGNHFMHCWIFGFQPPELNPIFMYLSTWTTKLS